MLKLCVHFQLAFIEVDIQECCLSEPQNAKERKRESNTKVCYVLSAKCVEKHQEKAIETAEESKNVVQGESYVGGRVLQLCAAQKCCKEQQRVSSGSATQEEE